MDTGVRIAMTLGSIDDVTSVEAGVLAVKEVTTDVGEKHLVLHISDANNSFVPAKNEISDDIDDVLNNIISRPQKDDIFVSEFDKTYDTQVGFVEKGTVTTPSYYRRIIVNLQTLINDDDVIKPLNKNELGWASIEVVDKRGATLLTREWNFYEMTGGDYKDGMLIGTDEDSILFDQDFDVPVKATFKYELPVGEYTGKDIYGNVRTIPCIRNIKFNFISKRVTTDTEFLDPSLQFMCKFDSNGNYTYASTDVINQFKADYRENYDKYKPYMLETSAHGVKTKVIPWLSEHMIFTELTFENEQFRDVGKLMEKMMKVIVRDQNNIFVRSNKLYKDTTKFIKKHMEENAVQEVQLLDLWSQISTMWSNVLVIDEWLPKTDILKPNPVSQELDLSRFDPTYMYKYKIVLDKNKLLKNGDHYEPIVYFSAMSDTDNSMMEGTSTSSGQLLSGCISKSEMTDYIRREVRSNETLAAGGPYTQSYSNDPLTPKTYTGPMMGDADNLYRNVSGTITCNRKTDVPVDAYITNPWVQVQIECYNVAGTLVKTIDGIFAGTNSNRMQVNFNGSNLTFNWSANLGGAYRYRYKFMVYWGTFCAWTDEVHLAYCSADGSDNSGGTYRVNNTIFNNQSNRVLTRCRLRNASKYEKNIVLNGKGYGWGGNVNPPITWDMNATLGVPGSANWWYADFYGKIYEKTGCDFITKDWRLFKGSYTVTGTRDLSSSVHYPNGTSSNYSIMTSINFSITGVGDKAYYIPDKYDTPSFYFPENATHTLLLRGSRKYRFRSSLPITLVQTGTFEVVVGTYDMKLNNTWHYGQQYIKNNEIILQGNKSSYKIGLSGAPDSETIINSGAPKPDMRKSLISKSRSTWDITDKPEYEYGVGQLTTVTIPYGDLFIDGQNHNIFLCVTDKDRNVIELSVDSLNYNQYQLIYNHDKIRIYMRIDRSTVYLMTYGINIQRAEFINRIESSLEFQLVDVVTQEVSGRFPLTKQKSSEHALAFEVSGKTYYINLSTEPDENDAESIKISDKDNRIVGYLSK